MRNYDYLIVEISIPFGDSQVAALEAFQALTPEKRLEAIEYLATAGVLDRLYERFPDLAERMRLGPGG